MSEIADISVTELVNDFLKKKYLEDNYRDNTVFHPSEFHGCKRKIAYQYFESHKIINVVLDKYSVDTRLVRVFDNGHKVHDRYKEYLSDHRCAKGMLKGFWKCKNKWAHPYQPQIYGKDEKYGILYPEHPCECGCSEFEYTEVGFFDKTYNFGGHVDVILFLPNGQHIIVDFKTIYSRGFTKLFGKPDSKHFTQMQIYLFLSGLEVGIFLYEDKDAQDIKEFVVMRDQKYIDRMLNYAENLKYIVEYTGDNGERKVPPRSNSLWPEEDRSPDVVKYNSQHKECKQCKFRSYCWKKNSTEN